MGNAPGWHEVAAALGLGIALTYAASGHAERAEPALAGHDQRHRASDGDVGVGRRAGVPARRVLPRREPVELGRVLPVFSRTAFCSRDGAGRHRHLPGVAGVGSLDALTSTRYGQLVLDQDRACSSGSFALGNLSRVVVQRRYVRPVAYAMTEPMTVAPEEVDETSADAAIGLRRGRPRC